MFARLAEVRIDDEAFPVFASPVNNARRTRSAALGFTWFLSKAVVFKFDYYHSEFGFAPAVPSALAAPLLRQDEKAVVTRVQLAF